MSLPRQLTLTVGCGGQGGAAVDESSRNVVAFLEGEQAVRQELHAVSNHYIRRGLKVSNYPGCGPTAAGGTIRSSARQLR